MTTEIEGHADDALARRLRFTAYPIVVFMDATGRPLVQLSPDSKSIVDTALVRARRYAEKLGPGDGRAAGANLEAYGLLARLSVRTDGTALDRLLALEKKGVLSADVTGEIPLFSALQVHRAGFASWRHAAGPKRADHQREAARNDYASFKEGRLVDDVGFLEYRWFWKGVAEEARERSDAKALDAALDRLEVLSASHPEVKAWMSDFSREGKLPD